jgi:hypothetical protein
MNCPRCNKVVEVISEYFDFSNECLVRDEYCSMCKSVVIEKFFSDSSYNSEWIDLNE